LFEISRERRPIEDRDTANIQVVVRAADKSLVPDGRSAGDRIDGRSLEIFIRNVFRLERVARFFNATRGEHSLLGLEVGRIELTKSSSPEPYEARVLVVARLRNGREQLGVKDRANLPFHIV